jgi:CheY-like chemotaxis protein
MKKRNILIIEDNEGDIFLIIESLKPIADVVCLTIINNGRDALPYLKANISSENKDLLELIILDINLPNTNGFEILQFVKTNSVLSTIPVVLFTSSSNRTDIKTALKLHANAFITKPIQLDEYLKAVLNTVHFFLEIHNSLNYHDT